MKSAVNSKLPEQVATFIVKEARNNQEMRKGNCGRQIACSTLGARVMMDFKP